jgi:hypothetical protein
MSQLACLSFVVALLGALAAAQAETVQGYVVHALTQQRVGGIEVAFYIRQDNQVREILRKTTDSEGRFSFSGPFLTPDLTFVLAALYQGVPYFSSALQVGAQKQVILEVYEPSNRIDGLHIAAHHLFLSLAAERLEVVQLVHMDNPTERTYVGQGQDSERRVTEFWLPAGVFGLQSHSGLMHQAGETRFFDNQPLLPGRSQISFSFSLDATRLREGYVHRVVYPTARLEVFLEPASIQAEAPFVDLGVVDLHGHQYRRVQLNDLQPGREILISLPLSRPLGWMLKWVALAVAGIAGLGVMALGSRAPGLAGGSFDLERLRRERQRQLEELARLDDQWAGRPAEKGYLPERQQRLDQVLALTRLLEEERRGQA